MVICIDARDIDQEPYRPTLQALQHDRPPPPYQEALAAIIIEKSKMNASEHWLEASPRPPHTRQKKAPEKYATTIPVCSLCKRLVKLTRLAPWASSLDCFCAHEQKGHSCTAF